MGGDPSPGRAVLAGFGSPPRNLNKERDHREEEGTCRAGHDTASTTATRPDTATDSVVQAEIFGLAGQLVERLTRSGVLAVSVGEHIHQSQPAMCPDHPER